MSSVRVACAAAAISLLAGCTVGPNFAEPSLFAPSSWFASRPPQPRTVSLTAPEPIDPDWWKLFNDPELVDLERQIAAANLSVRLATIRLAESRYERGVAAADQFPGVNGNASYTREKVSTEGVAALIGSSGSSTTASTNGLGGTTNGFPTPSPGIPSFDLFQSGFDASWEVDLWGRVRREVESADASVEASAEARRDSLLSNLAELARDYLQLRGQQRDLEIVKQTLASDQQSLSLTQERQRGGLTTDLDVSNAAAEVASTAAQIPNLEQQIATTMNALAFLLGETPGALNAKLQTAQPVPPVPPVIPVGVPSELARRRPDIREADAQLHAATADIGQAEADFLPKVTLSGSAGLQSLQLKNLGNWGAKMYSIGPSITLPIFEGGRLKYTLDLRKAQQQEAAVTYQQTVLRAFHEVDDALTAYSAEQLRQRQLATAVSQSSRTLDLARQQYVQGLATFLDVLTAERTLYSAQRSYADSTTTISTNLVQLYKALGGGWEDTFPRGAPSEAAPKLF